MCAGLKWYQDDDRHTDGTRFVNVSPDQQMHSPKHCTLQNVLDRARLFFKVKDIFSY